MIRASHLTKHYDQTTAVDDLSFDVLPGRVTGFLGPNGAGKSTTMRMILGLDRPDIGEAEINGQRYHELRHPLREVGALLDARAFHEARTAYHHLLALAQSNHIPRHRVDEVLELVGLTDVARRRAGRFSLGMAQRLGIAAALLGDPGVLLFDEPVNGLDPEGVLWIRTLLQALAREGRTVFVSSHLMTEMALTAEHLVVIGRGRLLGDLPLRELLRAGTTYVTVRSPSARRLTGLLLEAGAEVTQTPEEALQVTGLAAAHIGDLISQHHIVVHELAPHEASLEAAYFELTNTAVDFRAANLQQPEGLAS